MVVRMGVRLRGLTSWLREHGAEIANLHVLHSGALLLIDGPGVAFHILHSLSWSAALGGYLEIDKATRSIIAHLKGTGLLSLPSNADRNVRRGSRYLGSHHCLAAA